MSCETPLREFDWFAKVAVSLFYLGCVFLALLGSAVIAGAL